MNPFMLLIGPILAVGFFIVKMFVALGYVITGNFALVPQDGGSVATGTYEVREHTTAVAHLRIELESGELFRGEVTTQVDGDRPSPVATLASDRGRQMHCEFAYRRAPQQRAGVCVTDDEKAFDIVLLKKTVRVHDPGRT